ncbi:MAG: excinuclease ABC subunit UvrC [Deltaproteobacteria bacterium]|nr:excinuclease ABC subunit UvrC [Deltaproteobacteria bacterium]
MPEPPEAGARDARSADVAAPLKKKESREERRVRIAERVKTLPTDPGCYIMKDRAGEIFYVGKAGDLRARVKAYFSGSDTRQFVDWLDDLLDDLDVIVVRNEKEALLLERTLVRQHQPRFNVKLRDDKNFIHLRLVTKPSTDVTHPLRKRFPRVEVVRGPRDADSIERGGVRIFGPYHSATSARATLRVLNRHFQLRTCRDSVLENRTRPCLQHQIGRCPAPCVYDVPQYGECLNDAAMFLSGRRTELAERLRSRMLEYADQEAYESAARVRDQMGQIVTALHDQAVTDVEGRRNQDIYGIERRGSLLVLTRVVVRDGRMQALETFDFDSAEFPTEELVTSWLSQLYDDIDVQSIPDEVLLSQGLAGAELALQEVISERSGKRVEVKVPQRGQGGKLVEIALKNAVATIEERLRKKETREKGLATLQERLGLSSPPRVIECFDISLFQGEDAVASQVCFVDGAAEKSRYRRFNIKTVEGTDDFAMLYEAIGRRLRRGKELNDLPDLLVVDGGKGQLNVAITACRDNGIVVVNDAAAAAPAANDDAAGVPVFRIALASVAKARSFNVSKKKGGKARTRPNTPREDREGMAPDVAAVPGEDSSAADLQMSPERLFVPGVKDPLVLRAHTADRFLIEQLRDEAHRFAITAHRGRRKKRTLRSVLDEIPGIGPEKRKALLRVLGSAQAVADADVAVVAAVPGIGLTLAQRILDALKVDAPEEVDEIAGMDAAEPED